MHGRVIRIGREALRCLLLRRGITAYTVSISALVTSAARRTRTWKESPDPDRDAKLDRIEQVLDRFPDRVFAFVECGPLGIRPTGGSCWAKRGKPDRLPAVYRRTHGVTYFHGCYCVGDDRLWGVDHRRKGTAHTLAALKSARAARPDGAPVCIIWDNLCARTGQDLRRWAKKNKVELCFTAAYASWANPIEAPFGPLRQFTLANSGHRSHPAQTRALHRYRRWRNASARHLDVLAAQRKERARVRRERGIRWGGRPSRRRSLNSSGSSRHLRQNRWCVTPLGLGTTSRWNRPSSSSGDSHRRSPDPSFTGETATCMVSTRSASRNCRMVVTPPPSRTSLPCAACRARSRTVIGSPSMKWNVVSQSVNDGRLWWVMTNTGVRNGGSCPHQPRHS